MQEKLKKIFQRKLFVMLGILLSSTFLIILSSCSYDMSQITFSNETVTYDGNSHSLEISGTLPDSVSVTYDGNDQTEIGVYTVTAIFSGESSYDPINSLTATLTIKEADMTDVSFDSETFTYDGEYHSLLVSGITDTDRYTVSYSNNSQKNAGEYGALAIVTDTEGVCETAYLTATLTIEEATSADIEFVDVYQEYDGDIHSITATNLPTGVTATYSYGDDGLVEGESEIGTYTVTATFTDEFENYNIADMTATLYIQDPELSDISFTDETYTYDGETKSLEITGDLPTNITVSYEYEGVEAEGVTDAGSYEVTAVFTETSGAYEIKDKTATLTIEQADITDIVNFDDLYFNIDSNADVRTATMTYTLVDFNVSLPDSVDYTYSDNATQSEAGTYEVSVTFADTDGNYADATLTANMTVMIDEDETEDYTLENLNSNTLTATISSYTGTETDITIPTYVIDSNGVAYKVTAVDADTFSVETTSTNANIESIVFNDNITSIGENCCYGCTSLTTVTLPNNSKFSEISDDCFYGCTLLDSIDLPDSVTTIGTEAFYENTSLTEVDLSNITSLGTYAFYKCTSIATLTLSESLEEISDYSFYGSVDLATINSDETGVCNLPSALVTIGTYAFGSNSIYSGDWNGSLVKIVTDENLTTIEDSSFKNFYAITNITFNEGLLTIGNYAFQGSNILNSNIKVTDLSIPSTVTNIGEYAFAYSAYLETLTFEGNGTSVGSYAFYRSIALTSITTVDSSSTDEVTIGQYAFTYGNDTREMALETAVLSENVTIINNSAFAYDTNLTQITTASYDDSDNSYMPESLKIIDENAFISCSSLDGEINFSDNLYSVGSYAFSECDSLDSAIFGNGEYTSVASTTIQNSAFYGCNTLATAKLYGVSNVGYQSFYECSSLEKLYLNLEISTIGYNAFYDTNLANIYLMNSAGNNVVSYTYFSVYDDSDCISISSIISTTYLLAGYIFIKI